MIWFWLQAVYLFGAISYAASVDDWSDGIPVLVLGAYFLGIAFYRAWRSALK